MRNERNLIAIIWIVVALIAVGCGAPKQDWDLVVGGSVTTPLTVSYAELAKMPQTELEDILMQRSRGEDTVESWSGVALGELMDKVGASADMTGITAVAADGYAIEVSNDELHDAIVALKQNGEWIAKSDPEHGPIRLVTPKTPANRWVFQLAEIQVTEGPMGGIPADAALKVTGAVDTEIGWTEDQLRSMDTMEAESTNKAGETSTYIGVALNDLLGKAGVGGDASTVVFVADDGYMAEVALAEVQACADCIVSFRNQGGFSTVLPGFPGNVQVKGVVEIQVK
jgi:DMSO/TMAO reductase YedYZ molybdopterin-dependent catalytic subunit